MDNRKSITHSFMWSFLEQVGQRVVALAVQIVLARILAPDIFGFMAILLVFIDLANAVAQSGFGMAIIQADDVTDVALSSAFWLSMALSAILYIILFVTAPIIANFYSMVELALCLRVLSLVVFINAFNTIQRSYLQKYLNFKALFKSNLFASLFSGTISILMALLGCGLWALVAQTILQALFACIIMLVQVPWRPNFCFNAARAKELFSFGWKVGAVGILNVLYTGLSELIVGRVCNASDLGYYSNGRKYPNAGIAVVTNALQNVFFPAFANMKNDRDVLGRAIRRAIVIGSYISFPFCLFLAVAARPLVVFLLSDRWLPSVLVFQLTCVSGCFIIVQLINLRAYMALGDSGLYLKLQVMKIIVGIVLTCVAAIITRNIYWVALATCIATFINVIGIDLFPAKRMHGISASEQLRLGAPYAALSILACLLSYPIGLMDIPDILIIVLQFLVFFGVYLVISKYFNLRGFKETVSAVRSVFDRNSS